jgi:glycosyltransferase involved in cell wall biosynthesis
MNNTQDINIHVYHSDFRFESRILRSTQSAVNEGGFDHVIVLARHSRDQLKREFIDSKRTLYRLSTPICLEKIGVFGKVLSLIYWDFLVIFAIIKHRPRVISPHSVEVLPACSIAAALIRAKVIYETHELETQKNGSSQFYRKLCRIAEKAFVPRVSLIVTVCESISATYRHSFPTINVVTVRNFPLPEQGLFYPKVNLRRELGISDESILLLYQGALGSGRGIETLLAATIQLPLRYHTLFMGYGELEEVIRGLSKQYEQIHLIPAVPPAEVLSYTSQADIGICLIEGSSESYKYSLPNKLLEYAMAGIPTVVSNLPEMSMFIEEFQCGWVIESTTEDLTKKIMSLSVDEIMTKAQNCINSRSSFNWNNEVLPVINVYQKLKSEFWKNAEL